MQLAFCGHKHAVPHAVLAAALVAKTAPDVSLNLLGPNRVIASFYLAHILRDCRKTLHLFFRKIYQWYWL